jgi:hypothetical protein
MAVKPLGLPRRALDGHHRSSLFAHELMKSVACRLGACVGAILFERIRLDLDVAGSFVCQALDRILALRLFDFRDPLVVCLRKLAGQHELSEDLVILEANLRIEELCLWPYLPSRIARI